MTSTSRILDGPFGDTLLLVAFVVCLVALVATAALVVRRSTRVGADRVLGIVVWTAALLIAYCLALSLARLLTWWALLAVSLAGAAAAGLARRAGLIPLGAPRPPETPGAPSSWVDMAVATLVLVTLALLGVASLVTALTTPEPAGDNLAYHLPRIGYWIHAWAIHPFLANDPRVGSFPPNGNILQLFPILFLRSDRLAGLAQLAAAYATAFGIYALGRRLGAGRAPALLAAFLWFTIPVVLDQLILSNVDLVVACFSICAVYFMVAAVDDGSRFAAASSVVAAGVAVGAKPSTALLAGVVVAVVVLRMCRAPLSRRLAPVLGAGLVAAFVGLTFYAWNVRVFGHPGGLESVRWFHVDPGWRTLVKNAGLVFATPGYWLWRPARSVDPAVPADTLREALAATGLGIVWPLAALVAVVWVGIHAVRTGEPRARWPLYLTLLGLVYLGFVLGTLRHVFAATRYALAAVPIFTAVCAWCLGDLARRSAPLYAVAAALIVLPGAYVVAFNVGSQHVLRVTGEARPAGDVPAGGGAGVAARPEYARYDRARAEMARAIDELGAQRAIRVGLFTDHYEFERIALGPRYQNQPVGLSYDPPSSLARLHELALDAAWFVFDRSDPPRAGATLFRRRFEPPRLPPEDGWRVSRFRNFDAAFLRAAEASLFWQDLSALEEALANDRGWRIVVWNQAGVLLARGAAADQGTRLIGIRNANGLEGDHASPFFWMGQGSTVLLVRRGTAPAVEVEADFLPGPGLPNVPLRRLRIRTSDGFEREIVVGAGRHAITVPLTSSVAQIILTPLDTPPQTVLPNGDRRPLALGVHRLIVRAAPAADAR